MLTKYEIFTFQMLIYAKNDATPLHQSSGSAQNINFWNDWGDWDNLDDHMETRLKKCYQNTVFWDDNIGLYRGQKSDQKRHLDRDKP